LTHSAAASTPHTHASSHAHTSPNASEACDALLPGLLITCYRSRCRGYTFHCEVWTGSLVGIYRYIIKCAKTIIEMSAFLMCGSSCVSQFDCLLLNLFGYRYSLRLTLNFTCSANYAGIVVYYHRNLLLTFILHLENRYRADFYTGFAAIAFFFVNLHFNQILNPPNFTKIVGKIVHWHKIYLSVKLINMKRKLKINGGTEYQINKNSDLHP